MNSECQSSVIVVQFITTYTELKVHDKSIGIKYCEKLFPRFICC